MCGYSGGRHLVTLPTPLPCRFMDAFLTSDVIKRTEMSAAWKECVDVWWMMPVKVVKVKVIEMKVGGWCCVKSSEDHSLQLATEAVFWLVGVFCALVVLNNNLPLWSQWTPRKVKSPAYIYFAAPIFRKPPSMMSQRHFSQVSDSTCGQVFVYSNAVTITIFISLWYLLIAAVFSWWNSL